MKGENTNVRLDIRSFKGNIETYEIIDTIQDSLYGKVYQGYGVESGKMVAVKVLNKSDIISKEMNRLLPETPLAEVFFAEEMSNHEYLATIRDVFETDKYHCVVSDLADGEDLLELLRKNRHGLDEYKTRVFMKQAAIALNECHNRGFALQDFSLENCLLYAIEESQVENDGINANARRYKIRVCDPGQAIRFGKYPNDVEIPVPHIGCVGKKFRPPEIFSRKPYFASKVDSWCLGWSTFYLLFGIELFESVHRIDNDIRWQWYSMGYRDYLYSYLGLKDKLNNIARSFVESLVNPDPVKRMSIKEALEHPFLKEVDENDKILLDDWGRRSFVNVNIGNKTIDHKNVKIPFIPDVYKKKYMKIYCSKDKPSGYYPNNSLGNLSPLVISKFPVVNSNNVVSSSVPLSTNSYVHNQQKQVFKHINSMVRPQNLNLLQKRVNIRNNYHGMGNNMLYNNYLIKGVNCNVNPQSYSRTLNVNNKQQIDKNLNGINSIKENNNIVLNPILFQSCNISPGFNNDIIANRINLNSQHVGKNKYDSVFCSSNSYVPQPTKYKDCSRGADNEKKTGLFNFTSGFKKLGLSQHSNNSIGNYNSGVSLSYVPMQKIKGYNM